ncbi:phenylalanyl-tRNA synthetase alpha subunit, mitochondrial [Paramarasmius palmivorus]|uniref:Phenylalanyl-tRNA synthetase alpha subunit, mitochondrial n=1 Tax=Paramarasmius palmivorus TaxID=297713 RepID=A0AAW0DRY6_9AGAR
MLRLYSAPRCLWRRSYSVGTKYPSTIEILGQHYPTDQITNITPSIISKLPLRLHTQPGHPLCTLRTLIESHWPDFSHISSLSPLVTPYKNFDELSFPADHPGRSVTDSYYINKNLMLRTHADVYRRDEIDGSHYPVFHQVDAAKLFDASTQGMKEVEEDNERLKRHLEMSNIVIEDVPHISAVNPVQEGHDPVYAELVTKNLKLSLNSLILKLFGGLVQEEAVEGEVDRGVFPVYESEF